MRKSAALYCLNLGVKDGRNNNCISMYISTDSISSYTDRTKTMILLSILGFLIWMSPCLVASYYILKSDNGLPKWYRIVIVIVLNVFVAMIILSME